MLAATVVKLEQVKASLVWDHDVIPVVVEL
jgi:hypothetical protein